MYTEKNQVTSGIFTLNHSKTNCITSTYSYVLVWWSVCTRMCWYVSVCYSYGIRMYSYVSVCYSYVLVCHSYVLVCIRMLLVCHSYVLVCIRSMYPYVNRMYSCVIRMYSMYSYVLVCIHMLLVVLVWCFTHDLRRWSSRLFGKGSEKKPESVLAEWFWGELFHTESFVHFQNKLFLVLKTNGHYIKGVGQLKADCTSDCSIVCDNFQSVSLNVSQFFLC